MGRRSREHRDAVIAGRAGPYRVATPYCQYFICPWCKETLTEYSVESHPCFKEHATCQFVDPAQAADAKPTPCGKKAIYFRVMFGRVGIALCGQHGAVVEASQKQAASRAQLGQGGAIRHSGVVRVSPAPAPALDGRRTSGGHLDGTP